MVELLLKGELLLSVPAVRRVDVTENRRHAADVELWVSRAGGVRQDAQSAAAEREEADGELDFVRRQSLVLVRAAGEAEDFALADPAVDEAAVVSRNCGIEHLRDLAVRDLNWVDELVAVAAETTAEDDADVWALLDPILDKVAGFLKTLNVCFRFHCEK